MLLEAWINFFSSWHGVNFRYLLWTNIHIQTQTLQRRGARRIRKREKPQKNLEIALCQKHTMSFGANVSLLCGWVPLFHFHPTLQILTRDLTNLGFLVVGCFPLLYEWL
jgi:D-alanyl-lipoteichoic acid acyltransferase DltB (MBOAT superfamily)